MMNSFFDNNLLNVDFSITMADTDFKLCFQILILVWREPCPRFSILALVFILCQKSGNIL